jgi:hypothetical protein
MGVGWKIKTLSSRAANCARNRTAIRAPICTHEDGPYESSVRVYLVANVVSKLA